MSSHHLSSPTAPSSRTMCVWLRNPGGNLPVGALGDKQLSIPCASKLVLPGPSKSTPITLQPNRESTSFHRKSRRVCRDAPWSRDGSICKSHAGSLTPRESDFRHSGYGQIPVRTTPVPCRHSPVTGRKRQAQLAHTTSSLPATCHANQTRTIPESKRWGTLSRNEMTFPQSPPEPPPARVFWRTTNEQTRPSGMRETPSVQLSARNFGLRLPDAATTRSCRDQGLPHSQNATGDSTPHCPKNTASTRSGTTTCVSERTWSLQLPKRIRIPPPRRFWTQSESRQTVSPKP